MEPDMTIQTSPQPQGDKVEFDNALEIAFEPNQLLVSAVSSLLRVVQAALRETARLREDSRESFENQPQPVLLVKSESSEDRLLMKFVFADGMHSLPMNELSSSVFDLFMERFGQFLKKLPQPGFWKDSVKAGQQEPYDSEIDRRMDQLRLEMRRFPKVVLSYGKHAILIESNQMEID